VSWVERSPWHFLFARPDETLARGAAEDARIVRRGVTFAPKGFRLMVRERRAAPA